MKRERVPSRKSRDEIDPIFKEVLTSRMRQLNIAVQTQVEVSRLPRSMDALIRLRRNTDLEVVRSQTPFHHFLQHNQVEFKGVGDPLTIEDYHMILGRTHPKQITIYLFRLLISTLVNRKFLPWK